MKTILLLSTFLLFSLTIFGQGKFKPQFRIGLNNTNISNFNTERGFGYYIGLSYPVKVGRNKKMRVELTYDRQNTKFIATNFEFHSNNCYGNTNCPLKDKDIKMDFVTASFIYDRFLNDKLYVLISPFVSVITSQNFSQFQPGLINLMPLIDFGVIGGFGYKFLPQLSAEFRFKKGFEDVILLSDDTSTNTTNTFQLGLIYSFIK